MQTQYKMPNAVRWSLAMLCVVSTLNFVDRQIINILAEPIKQELGLRDWHIGLLTGLVFSLFYSAFSLPAARYAERAHRPRFIAFAVATWSVFTALSGLASNFITLLLARAGVGIGECASMPAAQSLISDYVPPEKRAGALSIFALGVPIGALLGLAIGGFIVDHYGWRAAFLVVGFPGILVALIVALTVREPRVADRAHTATAILPLREVLKHALGKRSFRWILLATMMFAAVQYGQFAFMASFFLRAHGAALAELAREAVPTGELGAHGLLGLSLGLSSGITGILGIYLGGRLTDYWVKRDVGAYLYIPGIAAAFSVPLYIAMLFVPSVTPALILLAIHAFFTSLTLAPMMASVLGLVPPRSRATAAALFAITGGLIGQGLGPVLIGALSDLFNAGGYGIVGGLRYSLLATKSLVIVCSLALFAGVARYRAEFLG